LVAPKSGSTLSSSKVRGNGALMPARYHQLMLAEFANRGDDPTGLVEILSIVHDRMLLPRAARRAQR